MPGRRWIDEIIASVRCWLAEAYLDRAEALRVRSEDPQQIGAREAAILCAQRALYLMGFR